MNPFVADPDWGIWIILYFYFGGMAAGAYFLATLIALFGREEDRPISRIGYWVAMPLIAVCGILLIVDLERPDRFWHMLLQSTVVERARAEGWPLGGWGTMFSAAMFKRWSPMSLGAWALALFGLCSTLSFVGTLHRGGRLERWLVHGLFGRALAVVGSLVGFFIGSYTGVLLTASNQPLWSLSDWIGPLFLASAASTGIATVLLIAQARGESPALLRRLERADLWALGLELFVFLIFLASLQHVLALALLTTAGLVMVLGTLFVGLLVPLWLHLKHDPRRLAAASVCALAGGFALRYGLLKTAPALLEQFPQQLAHLSHIPWWQRPPIVGLLIVTLILAVGIPLYLKRQWQLTGGQAALAWLASALACTMVFVYTVRPASGYPWLESVTIPGFAPEYERPRGGGVGASASNRPSADELELRSKITGTLPDEP
jgi:protein NrfD